MLVAVVIAAFLTGGAAIIAHIWWLLWACIGIVVLAIPAGKVIGIMDDTVAWGSTPAATATIHVPTWRLIPGGQHVPPGDEPACQPDS